MISESRNEIDGQPPNVSLDLYNWQKNTRFDEQKCAWSGYNGKIWPVTTFNFVHFEAV